MSGRGLGVATLIAAALAVAGCAPGPRRGPAVEPPESGPAGPEWPDLDALAAATDQPAYPDLPGPEWPDLADALPKDAPPPPPLIVRVGLGTGVARAVVACEGPARLLDADGLRALADLAPGAKVTLQAAGRLVRWQADSRGGEAAGVGLQPVDPDDAVTWNRGRWRGALLALPRGGALTLVNAVGLEDYLRGVVPGEIGRLGPEGAAALEAQAIAARTYTVAHRGQHAAQGFDVWSDVRDQLYEGIRGEHARCDEAIARTAGLVLQYGGREIEAYYSSTCGGRTAGCEQVWSQPARPYLTGRRDAPRDGARSFCASAPRFAWQESWSGAELERILQRTLPQYVDWAREPRRARWAGEPFTPRGGGGDLRRPGRLLGCEVRGRTACGRVALLDVATEAGVYHVRGDRARSVLLRRDGGLLWSALFRLAIEPGQDGRPLRVAARGRGYGHGVGLCQTGAIAMARRGFSAGQILAHYYAGATLAAYDLSRPPAAATEDADAPGSAAPAARAP